ncbi:tripartite tricarboxylate transporter TctB family protein [Devosia albogilva]|uniref:Tripartite tricarboxylate transporter TctB family protein n=1 Tax=Devosia albogilva TaxID=429726 RepID=A0ABW5QQB2_9HYPH
MKITQDAVQGSLFLGIGATALIIALGYPMGTPNRMGPGFFPVVISGLLTLVGIAILARGVITSSEAIRVTRWLPLVIVPGAIVLFGLLLDGLGLPLAVLVLTIGAATASVRFAFDWRAVAGAVLFAAICGVLFVRMLGLPIPLVGTWVSVFGA